MGPHAHHRDQVDVTGDRVDLAHPGQRSDLLGHGRDARHVGLDEHDRGDHGSRA